MMMCIVNIQSREEILKYKPGVRNFQVNYYRGFNGQCKHTWVFFGDLTVLFVYEAITEYWAK